MELLFPEPRCTSDMTWDIFRIVEEPLNVIDSLFKILDFRVDFVLVLLFSLRRLAVKQIKINLCW